MEDKEDKQVKPLDRIRPLETKFITLCKVAFGISFKVKKWDPANDEDTMEVAGTSGFLGTQL